MFRNITTIIDLRSEQEAAVKPSAFANDYKDPWYAISEEYWDETLKKWGLNS